MIFSLLKTNNYSYSRKLTNKITAKKQPGEIKNIAILQRCRCNFTKTEKLPAVLWCGQWVKDTDKYGKSPFHRAKWGFLLYLRLSRNSVGDIPVIFWKFLYAVER